MHKFIIVGTPRTGSSALAQLISFHPEIICGWQWSSHIHWWRKIRATQRGLNGDFSQLAKKDRIHMQGACTSQVKCIGYRALFRSSDKWMILPRYSPVFWLDRFEKHINWMAKNSEIGIIHIVRNDNLAWLKSYMFSRITRNYIGKPNPTDLSITINQIEAISRIRSKLWLDKRFESLKNSNPYFRVNYESLNSDIFDTGKSVIDFLGFDSFNYQIDESKMCAKQSKGPLSDGLENYNELVTTLIERNLLEA